jgi:leader peptidase (prepilin peptidase)/N-methyltransferase
LDVSSIIWPVFLFSLGASVGSFINVVVYRIPRDESIVRPGSHCTTCQKPIAWYDNVPILAWFYLGGKCRHCGASFSIRYPLIELFTALLFVTVYWVYFSVKIRAGLPAFTAGGWVIYSGHMVLLSVMLACSIIDAEHRFIPSVKSAVITALILSMIWPYLISLETSKYWHIIPYSSVKTAALAFGCVPGLGGSLLFRKLGWITQSMRELQAAEEIAEQKKRKIPNLGSIIRREMVRELAFLAPILLTAIFSFLVLTGPNELAQGWQKLILGQKWIAGLLGSVYGYMIGAGVVWATRILGSLTFGKEAMGLGDVYLMAAVGAMLGWASPVLAFFAAPFLALSWALPHLILHRTREIRYGPFLSVATLAVMIMHDTIIAYFERILIPPPMP